MCKILVDNDNIDVFALTSNNTDESVLRTTGNLIRQQNILTVDFTIDSVGMTGDNHNQLRSPLEKPRCTKRKILHSRETASKRRQVMVKQAHPLVK